MDRWVLSSGRGARSAAPFSGAEFIVAPELDGGGTEARILLGAPVERSDIEAAFEGRLARRTSIDWKDWLPSVRTELYAGGLLLETRREGTAPPDDLREGTLARLKAEGLSSLPWGKATSRLLARCRFVQRRGSVAGWPDFSEQALCAGVTEWLLPFGDWTGGAVWDEGALRSALLNRLGRDFASEIDRIAPERVTLPSGSRREVDYESGEVPVIAARLQEFLGCADTPLIGGEPAMLHLLSPAGRPVQVTRDLGGFWVRTYDEVRKELRGRYPRHYWPENPLEAEPTSRAKPRGK